MGKLKIRRVLRNRMFGDILMGKVILEVLCMLTSLFRI